MSILRILHTYLRSESNAYWEFRGRNMVLSKLCLIALLLNDVKILHYFRDKTTVLTDAYLAHKDINAPSTAFVFECRHRIYYYPDLNHPLREHLLSFSSACHTLCFIICYTLFLIETKSRPQNQSGK